VPFKTQNVINWPKKSFDAVFLLAIDDFFINIPYICTNNDDYYKT